MATVRLTKTQLRIEQLKLKGLERYLPTLQLKKALLQSEVSGVEQLIGKLEKRYATELQNSRRFASLLTSRGIDSLFSSIAIEKIEKSFENVAGLELPSLEKVVFAEAGYSLFDTPYWVDSAAEELRTLLSLREELRIMRDKKTVLQNELRQVSIRVNLFEKIMIPRAKENIRKIKIFLGDQQLSAVGQAKAALHKILLRKQEEASL